MGDTNVYNELLYWKFDNDDFEKKAAQTLTTLQKLEKALNIKGAVDATRNIKLDQLAKDVDLVASRFTNLGIMGKRVLEDIADKAVRTGKKFISSLTIDDARTGWTKYEEQIGAVQTLMNTTGMSAKQIQSYVDKFAVFSDETSYSLDQMVKAFSQMTTVADLSGTAADKAKELKKIQDMIIGIANASAFAGKTGAEFQRTIYNVTQSYQMGQLNLQDWKSLQLAGTASKQLTEQLIKAGEDLYKQSKGKNGFKEGTVTVQNFSSMLKKGLIDMEVMQDAFGKFGELSVAAVEAVMDGKYDTFADAIEALGGDFSELARRAAESSYEAKTFKEAIASVHDAISTKWSQSYQLIVGDYEEARWLWTKVANTLWDIFAAGGNERNEVLKQWANENGRFFLIVSLQNILNAILDFVNPIKEAWESVFAPINGHQLALLTKQLQNFTLGLRINADTQAKIKSVVTDFAKSLKILLDIFGEIIKPIKTIIGPLDEFGIKVLNILKVISLLVNSLVDMASKSETAIKVSRVLLALLVFKKQIGGSVKLVVGFTKTIIGLVGAIKLLGIIAGGVLLGGGIFAFTNWITKGKGAEHLENITKKFRNLRETINSFDTWKLEDYVNAIKNIGSSIKNAAFNKISEFFGNIDWRSVLPNNISIPIDNLISKFGNFRKVVSAVGDSIKRGGLTREAMQDIFDAGYSQFIKTIYNVVAAGTKLKGFFESTKKGLGSVTTGIKNAFSKDALTGLSPFQNFISNLKESFSSREGILNLLDQVKNKFVGLTKVASAPWKLSGKGLTDFKEKLKGLPKLIFDASSGFKGFLESLKNPETIKNFGKTITDIFSKVGTSVLGGFDIITKGKYHDTLEKIASAFGKVKTVAGSITSKGIETFYNVLSRLYSLFSSSSYVLSHGVSRIKDSLGSLDVRLGALGPRMVSLATTIKTKLPSLLNPILKIFDGITGHKYSNLLSSIKALFGDLLTTISRLGGAGFKTFTSSLKQLFDTFASGAPITKTIEKLKEAISSFFNLFKRGNASTSISGTDIAAPVRSMAAGTSGALDTLQAFADRVVYVIEGVKSAVKKVTDVIPPEFYGHIKTFIKSILGILVLRTVLKPFSAISNGITSFFSPFKKMSEEVPKLSTSLQNGITNFFSPFKAIAEGITKLATDIGNAVTSLADAIRGKWKAEAFEKRANGIFKLASAVGVLAGAVWVVAQIPIEKGELRNAVIAISVLMGALLGFATFYDKIGSNWIAEVTKIESITSKLAGSIFYFGKSSMIASLAVSMIAMAGAVIMLMKPVKELSEMKWEDFIAGFGKVVIIMGSIAIAVGTMGHAVKGAGPGILAATVLLLTFNFILRSFLKTMSQFGELFAGTNSKKMLAGAIAVGATLIVTMGCIVQVAKALSQFTTNAKYVGAKVNPAAKALLATGALLLGITFFLNSMANTIKKFRDLKVRASEIGKTILAIAGILGGIALYAKILKTAGLTEDIKVAGKLMLGFAGALALVGVALHIFSSLDLEGVANALPAIIGAVVSMLGVIWTLGKIGQGVSLGSGVAILGFAALLTSLSVSLMLLTLVDYAKLENAAESLSGVLLSLGVSLGLASKFSGRATGLIAFSFVIKELTTSLLLLSFIDYAKLESAANNLSKVLFGIGVAMALSGGMAATGILQWIGIIFLIGTLTTALIVLQEVDVTKLKGVATALGGLEVITGIVMALSSLGLATGGAAFASLFGATLLVGGVARLLYVASTIPDPEAAVKLMDAATRFLGITGVVIGILGSIPWYAGIQAALLVISFFGILAAAIAFVAYELGSDDQQVLAAIERLEKGFERIGNFIGDIAAGIINTMIDKAGASLDKITGFLESIKPLKDIIAESDVAGITRALDIAKTIISLEIPNDGGLAGLIFGNNNIGDFGNDIFKFGIGLKAFCDSIQGIQASDEQIENAIKAARGLADLAQAIPSSGDESLAAALIGVKDLGVFAAQIAGASNISGEVSEIASEVAGANVGLGEALRLFADSIQDIPDDAWETAQKAVKAAKSIADFAHRVPKTDGILQKIAGTHDLAKFALSLAGDGTDGNPGFISSLAKLVEVTSTIDDPSDAVKKIKATEPLITFFKDNTSIWDSLTTFFGKYEYYNPLVPVIKVLTEYAKELGALQQYSYLDAEQLTNITDAITATEPAIIFFKDHISNLKMLGAVEDISMDKSIGVLKEYAHQLALLSAYNINTSTLASTAQAFEETVPLLKFYDDHTSVIESAAALARRWLNAGTNPLVDAIKELIPYAQALKEYSNEISGIDDMNKVIRSTTAFGNFASAVQTLFNSQNLTQTNSFEYISGFTSKLEELAKGITGFAKNFGGTTDLTTATNNVKLVSDMFNDISKIGPLSADGFITSLGDLADFGLAEFNNKFSDSETELNVTISNFLTTIVSIMSRTANQDRLKTGATNLFKGYKEGQKQALDEAKAELEKFIYELPDSIKINDAVMTNIGLKITSGIGKGIRLGVPEAVQAAEYATHTIMTAVGEGVGDAYDDPVKGDESIFGIFSGLKVDAGIAKGIADGMSWVGNAVGNLGTYFTNTFGSVFGEGGSVLSGIYKMAGDAWGGVKNLLTGGFESLTGVNLAEIIEGKYASADGEKNSLVDWITGWAEKFLNVATETEEETEKIANKGANAVGDVTGKAASKAVKDAKDAGKEILDEEDAFWAALLLKKQAGANASEYQDMKVKDFEKKMLEEVNKLVDDYKEKLNSTTDDILGMIGLFDKVEEAAEDTANGIGDIFKSISGETTKLEGNIEDLFRRVDSITGSNKNTVSGDELMANLQDQIDKYTEYYDIQDELAKRIGNNKLKKTLREMTIDSIEELRALNDMSDKKLDEYVALFEERLEVASRDKTKEDADESPTAAILTQNLEDQVAKYKEYKEVISNLNARVTSKKLKETLTGMGIDNMDQLKAIESMTDAELDHYTELFDEKYSLSRDVAEIRLEETKQETEDKLNELLEMTGLKLDMFLEQFDGTLSSLTDLLEGHLNSLTLGDSMGHIAQELISRLLEVFNYAGMTAEERIVGIRKAIESAVMAGVDITDQYSQAIIMLLDNTELTADEKLQQILQLMTDSQVSLAQSSQNLAQTTKDTIAKILSNAEASKLINSLMNTLNSGVESAQSKIDKFKEAIRLAGENNVQLTEVYRTQIEQLLADTTLTADAQIAALLQILQNATLEYQNWALQDISLLSADLLAMSQVAQNSLGGSAKASYNNLKNTLHKTTGLVGEELDNMTDDFKSSLAQLETDGITTQERINDALENTLQSYGVTAQEKVQATKDAVNEMFSFISSMESRAYASAGGGGGSSRSSRDAISMWESATGRTLTDAQRQFALNGGTIVGGGGSQVIKDGKYWDSANHTAYDLGSGVAEYTGAGFVSGMKQSEKSMQNQVVQTGTNIIYAAKETFGISSPSKVFMDIAKFVVLGWVEGMKKYSHLMDDSGVGLADSYIDTFNDSIRNVEMLPDITPTITPIIDMSRAQAAMDAIDNLFNTDKSYTMASDIKRAADIAARAKAEADKPTPQAPAQTTNMNFTQNNYSPKALSKLDIYRQTKNQFAQMKGALA